MKSVNKVIVVGNIGKDPETKFTPSGTAVCTFSVACNERFKDRDGQWQDRTEWVNVKAWARLAEICRDYLSKGKQVYVEGRLNTESWEANGERKYRTVVVANDIVLLGSGGERSADDSRPSKPKPSPQDEITDDDIPF